MQFIRNKKVLVGILVIAVAFFVYAFFFGPDEDSTSVLTTSQPSAPDAQFLPGQEVIVLLTDLKSIQLDPEIFSNPTFQSLVDYTLPLEPEPQGRNNPFAPIGTNPQPSVGGGTTAGEEESGGETTIEFGEIEP